MTTTPNLGITLIEASQNQKEVTMNEALIKIDASINSNIIDKDLSTPPGSPTTGAMYIIGATATGDWAGHENEIAFYNGGWKFIEPSNGMSVYVLDEAMYYKWNGTSWAIAGLISLDTGEFWRPQRKELILSGLSGALVTQAGWIPDRAMVFGVHTRVTTLVTGATSFSVGYTGQATAFGNGIALAVDTTNIGILPNPTSFYANTNLIITPAGSNFTGGAIKLVMHYFEFRGPWTF